MTTTINASTSSGLVVTPDNSGVVQLQYSGQPGPAFNAALTGSGAVSFATGTSVIFQTIYVQRGGSNYNTSTGVFTAPVTGFYMFAVNLLIDTSQGAASLDFQLFIAGSTSGNSLYQTFAGGSYYQLSGSWVVSLTAGNTVSLVNQTGSVVKLYGGNGGDIQTHFSGFLIA